MGKVNNVTKITISYVILLEIESRLRALKDIISNRALEVDFSTSKGVHVDEFEKMLAEVRAIGAGLSELADLSLRRVTLIREKYQDTEQAIVMEAYKNLTSDR